MCQDELPEKKKDPSRPQMTVSGKGNIIGDFNQVVQNFLADPHLRWYLAGLAGLVIVVGVGLYFLLRPSPVDRTPMNGNFNIAVANFTVEGSSGGDLGMSIARVVYANLESNLGDLVKTYVIDMRGPDTVERISGNEVNRSDAAGRIARRIQADLVVYGTVQVNGLQYAITPEFYINPDRLPEDKEVTGPYKMGQTLDLTGPTGPAFNEELGILMSERMRVLTLLSTGLSFFSTHRYDKALARFQEAENEPWPEGMGREVLYLLAGNAAGKSQEYGLAEEYYTRALGEDPEYARARIGLGSVSYMRALLVFNQTQNFADIDLDVLAQSVQAYQSALEAKNQPEGADIEAKVHLGVGQCFFYQALAGALDSFDPAMQEFQAVTQAYTEDPNPRIQELAGEAYGHQGLIYRLQDQKEQAIEAYEQAVRLMAIYPQRQKMYQSRLDDLNQ